MPFLNKSFCVCAMDMTLLGQKKQCFGSGSGRIRIIWSDPDPDPYQDADPIWIRVASKINQNHGINNQNGS